MMKRTIWLGLGASMGLGVAVAPACAGMTLQPEATAPSMKPAGDKEGERPEKPSTLKVTGVIPVSETVMLMGVTCVRYKITFEGGAALGVNEGMEFKYPKGASASTGTIRIMSVGNQTCGGEYCAYVGPGDRAVLPKAGEVISTSDDVVTPVEDAARPASMPPQDAKEGPAVVLDPAEEQRIAALLSLETPLHKAARTGDHASIRALVAAGSNVDSVFVTNPKEPKISGRLTPLMLAAGSADGATVETVRLLLELGANPTLAFGAQNALHHACVGFDYVRRYGGDVERLRALIEAGCRLPTDRDNANRLICGTARAGDPARLRVLLDAGVSARAPDASRLIHDSDKLRKGRDDTGIVKMIEAYRAGPPRAWEIPLFQAAESGSAECVEMLILAGANPLGADESGRTAIYYTGSAAASRMLMKHGVAIDQPDGHGSIPLSAAICERGSAQHIRALVEAGADINARDEHNNSFFLDAVSFRHDVDVLRMLVSLGADPRVDRDGYNAFHASISMSDDGPAPELEEGRVRRLYSYLREVGVDINQQSRGATPLGVAMTFGSATEVRLLLEVDADPTLLSARPRGAEHELLSPIFLAFSEEPRDVDEKIEAFLNAGVDLRVSDPKGRTPLEVALREMCGRSSKNGCDALIEVFNQEVRGVRIEPGVTPTNPAGFKKWYVEQLSAGIDRMCAATPDGDWGVRTPEDFAQERKKEVQRELKVCVATLCAQIAWEEFQKQGKR